MPQIVPASWLTHVLHSPPVLILGAVAVLYLLYRTVFRVLGGLVTLRY